MSQLVPHHPVSMSVGLCDIQQIGQYSFQNPQCLTRLCKAAEKTYSLYLDMWAQFRAFQRAFHREALEYGVICTDSLLPPDTTYEFECHLCAATFKSHKALCAHVFKRHNLSNVAQRYAIGNQCRACLKTYHSRDQLIHHLKYYRTGCIVKLNILVPALTDDELQIIQQEASQTRAKQRAQQRTGTHKWPVVQAAGPLRPWPWVHNLAAIQPDKRPPPLLPSAEIQTWVRQVLAQTFTGQVSHVLHALDQQPYHGILHDAILSGFRDTHQDPISKEDAEMHLALQEAIMLWKSNALIDPANPCLPVRQSPAQVSLTHIRVPAPAQALVRQPFDERRATLVEELWTEDDVVHNLQTQLHKEMFRHYQFPTVPKPCLVSTPVFVYLFSGRRRPGDYQTWVEYHLKSHGLSGNVLLLDLALSQHHDITSNALVKRILSWIRDGCVTAALLAPPCETWSEVRFVQETEGDPRPLRSRQNPMCLSGLLPKELQQLSVANCLLMAALRIFLACAMTGIPCVCSLWSNFKQTHESGRMPRSQLIQQMKQPVDWSSLQLLQGKEHGAWRTSAAKEYPPRLNETLALMHVWEYKRLKEQHPTSRAMPTDYAEGFAELYAGDVSMEDQTMQPDYGRVLHNDRLELMD
eukprot:Skav203636  [mRNA]  locus=scaffold1120:146269:148289:- [translate_table: standard]